MSTTIVNGTTGIHGTNGTSDHPSVTPAPAAGSPVLQASNLSERAAQAVEYIKMGIEVLALDAPALTDLERSRLARLRRGGEKHVPLIAQLAKDWNVSLRTQPTATMNAASATVAALQPLGLVLRGFQQEVDDTNAVATGVAWSTAGALYSVLKRMAKKDPTLTAQLLPVTEFFAYRRPAMKAVKPGKAAKKAAKKLDAAKDLVAEDQAKGGAQGQPVQAPKGVNGVSGVSAANGASTVNGVNAPSAGGDAH